MIPGKTSPAKLPLDGRQPQNLSEWLEVAIWNLVPSAQTRVRPEIEAHYAEAKQSHLALGSSAFEAAVAALADLGDAHIAAKRFEREYLTTQEIEVLVTQAQKKPNRSLIIHSPLDKFWNFLYPLGLILILGLAFAPSPRIRTLLSSVLIPFWAVIFLAVGMVLFVRYHQKIKLPHTRRTRMLQTINWLSQIALLLCWGIACFMGFDQNWRQDQPYLWLIMILGFGIFVLGRYAVNFGNYRSYLRLRKKWATAKKGDLPPLDSSAA